jgi:hypothetical protein
MDIFPGITNAKALTAIKRERLLPRPGEVTMRIGQQVAPVQIIARTIEQPRYVVLNASRVLGVPPEDVSRYLLIEEGSSLSKGKPVMRKPASFGRGKLYNSPVDGILYNVYNGRLILQLTPEVVELRAMVHGYVNNVIAHRGVVLEINGTLIQAIWGSGKEGVGRLKMGSQDELGEFAAATLDKEAHGSIVFAGRVKDRNSLDILDQNGVKGLIVGSMPAALCAAAGQFSYPIILTDSIGTTGMAQPIFKLLQAAIGQETTLFAQTSLNTGQRPEIIIPLPATTNPTALTLPGTKLEIGQAVRIIRAPHTSQVGKVSRLYERVKSTSLGTRIAGADVTLRDGQVIYVPYTNLDLLS